MGRYVCNLSCARELDTETLRQIAYDINPDLAMALEDEAYYKAEDIRNHAPDYGIAGWNEGAIHNEIERLAKHALMEWLLH